MSAFIKGGIPTKDNEAFSKRIQRAMGTQLPGWIPRGMWHGKPYSHILTDINQNFIDGIAPQKSCLKGTLTQTDIQYHRGAAHLNSSQVMCISFFQRFFDKCEYEGLLCVILRQCGLTIPPEDSIASAAFEYEPNKKEGTCFDFYLIFESGKRITFECKYTESDFGGLSPDKNDCKKYDRKWDDIYHLMVATCPYLQAVQVGKEEFYRNYQINRNIAHAALGDTVVFLTPRANDASGILKGLAYIEQMNNDHIRNLYWEDVVQETLYALQENHPLTDYYTRFYEKYIRILPPPACAEP